MIGNGIRGIEWSCDRRRHVTIKGQGRDPNIFNARYFENGRDRDSVTMGHL